MPRTKPIHLALLFVLLAFAGGAAARARPADVVSKIIATCSCTASYYGNAMKIGGTPIILTGEGRAVYNNGNWAYEYDLKDHLGNTRVSFAAGRATAAPLQYIDYYPFGLEMANGLPRAAGATRFLYAGKELHAEAGLDWHDFGARHYDPLTGRWTTPDPLAEKYYSWSPYAYCADNPMNITDPDGMDWFTNRLSGEQKWFDNNRWRLMFLRNIGGTFSAPGTTVFGTSRETRAAVARSYEFEQNLNQQGIETYRTTSRLEAFASWISLGALTEFKGLGGLFKPSKAASAAGEVSKAASTEVAAVREGARMLNQFNSVESLIQNAGNLTKVKAGLQGFVKGDGASIYNTITRGGTMQANGTILMQDGTTIFNHFSTKTGVFTIDINITGQIYKIRIEQ